MNIRVVMFPELKSFHSDESGIRRVVEAYYRYLPEFGIDIVPRDQEYHLVMSHAGTYDSPDIAICHGLYWTADYDAAKWEWAVNADVIDSIRHARYVTVPSRWVQEAFQRDMRFSPTIVPHGIEWDEWQSDAENLGYILWNKNRISDVCNPLPVSRLAEIYPNLTFATTFAQPNPPRNVQEIGLQHHDTMKKIVQSAGVYLSTTKETFGIGTLEALASGVPVLGFAHGGNLDIVQHGVNGYLAYPDNLDDLAEGLNYCIKHHKVLSENARELAKQFTWRNAARIVADICGQAVIPEGPTINVVIPSYNYGTKEKLGRAIESVLAQTIRPTAITVVDDGSEDDGATERLVRSYQSENDHIRYVRQDNRGVAVARNTGIGAVRTKYVCCLDADDAVAPEFLRACIEALEKDTSLGIAYTGLWYIKPDGSEGLSPWPDQYNFDKQIERQNQVPTCCVYRRVAWERLGGYKARYAPQGAGSEDAEFFLRMGAYGWKARKVTDAGLFIYSFLSGRVSGNKDYHEVNWTELHPWTADKLHPFASVATPENKISHPVRQYDEPTISVVIPVGPGHEEAVRDALDSLESQTFRKWEAIIVWDGTGKDREPVERSYPYIHSVINDTSLGAGAARNAGAMFARAPLLLFLDADDWLYPEALAKLLHAYRDSGAIVYPDYVGKSFMSREEAVKLGDRLLYYDEHKGEAVIRYQSSNYDHERAVSQPVGDGRVYIWNLVSSLTPKAWHQEIGGFDTKMESWEDWDYWLRMARAGKCFKRVPEELIVYRFYTGNRREVGIQNNRSLIQYLLEKFEGIEIMPCNCGKGAPPPPQNMNVITSSRRAKESVMNDSEVVLIEYLHLNKGQHKVVGPASHQFLGYRASGDRFYVPRIDVSARPDLFRIIEQKSVTVQERTEETPAPKPVQQSVLPRPEPDEAVVERLASLMKKPTDSAEQDVEVFDLTLVPGVTPAIANKFEELGIKSFEGIIALKKEGLLSIKGIGEGRASAILSYAQERLREETKPVS